MDSHNTLSFDDLREMMFRADPEWGGNPPMPGSFAWYNLDDDQRARLIPRLLTIIKMSKDTIEQFPKAICKDFAAKIVGLEAFHVVENELVPFGKALLCDRNGVPMAMVDATETHQPQGEQYGP